MSQGMLDASRRIGTVVAGLGLVALLGAGELRGQVAFGAQAAWGSDTDLGIGGRVLGNIEQVNLEGVGEFNLFFPDGDVDFWEINANLFYHFHLEDTPSVLPYVGGGLNIAHVSVGGAGDTEAGVNLAGGVRFPTAGEWAPYLELRAAGVGADTDQLVLTGGILIGPTGGR